MRLSTCLFATVCVACLIPTYIHAQGGDERRGEEQTEPYRKHRDTRHGHDHIYPDRGSIVRNVASGAVVIHYAGVSYRFDGGVWFEPRGPAFIVVEPPIGLMVPALPGFATPVVDRGETYLYANNVYYRARPEIGGYEVVNDPGEGLPSGRSNAAISDAPVGAPVAPAAKTSAVLLAAAPVAAGSPASVTATPVTAGPPASVPATATAASMSPGTPASASAATSAVPAAMQLSTSAPSSATAAIPAPASTTALAASTPPAIPASSPAPTLGAPVAQPIPVAPLPSSAAPTATLAMGYAAAPSASVPQVGPKVFIYPRSGQNTDQQARDRYECYRFGVVQSGFDPMRVSSSAPQTPRSEQQSDYERAQAACLEGRGYSVR